MSATMDQLRIKTAEQFTSRLRAPTFKASNDHRVQGVQGEPQTEFARRMLAHRRKIESSGRRLLTLDEVRAEVKARRGELD